jgi:hypothetical protein
LRNHRFEGRTRRQVNRIEAQERLGCCHAEGIGLAWIKAKRKTKSAFCIRFQSPAVPAYADDGWLMRGGRGLLQLALAIGFFLMPCCAQSADETSLDESEDEKLLLDHLITAESGGRQFAENPRSSALGPFQFLEGTFLDIMRRQLPALTAGKSDAEISRLRVDPEISRNAALLYIRESAKFFAARNVPVTATNLRLAFFVGQTGALRLLKAKSDKPLGEILGASVIAANPRLSALTAGQLIDKSSQEVEGVPTVAPSLQPGTLTAGPPAGSVSTIAANPPNVSSQNIEGSSQEADLKGAPGSLIAGQPAAESSPLAGGVRTAATNLEPNLELPSQTTKDIGAIVHPLEELSAPAIMVRCNLKLPSCKKWLALAENRLQADSRH